MSGPLPSMLLFFLLLPGLSWAADRPNILLIVTDNQSEQLLGAYGNTDVLTPNIDTLARDGMKFDRFYATSGVCSPTRASLMTGLMPSQHGVHNGLPSVFDIPDWSAVAEFRSLPQTLAEAGYATGLIGKYHLGAPSKAQIGFQHWVTFPTGHTTSFHGVEIIDKGSRYRLQDEHLTDFWSRQAVDYIARQSAERPFFLYLAYNGPYNLPPLVNREPRNRHAAYYAENVPTFPQEPVHPFLRNAAIEESSVEDVQREQKENREWGVDDAVSTGAEGARPELSYGWQTIDALNNKTAMINLASEMTMIDDGVGRVLAALQERELADNTIVVFTSDQSSAYGQHGLWGNSSWARPHPVYKEHMQVPLILRYPGRVRAGTATKRVVSQVDVFPTLLALTGLNKTIDNSVGRDFTPLLTQQSPPWSDKAYFEYITVRAVIDGDWKYVKRLFGEPSELYHLAQDPNETLNLINHPEHRDVMSRLDKDLDAFFHMHASPKFDIWRGGTGKAILMYSNRNERFAEADPDWREPFIEQLPAFSDRQ